MGWRLRRANAAVVIVVALSAKARGVGHLGIAAALIRPDTVRGWLRPIRGPVAGPRRRFTMLARAMVAESVLPEPAGSRWADALAATAGSRGEGL